MKKYLFALVIGSMVLNAGAQSLNVIENESVIYNFNSEETGLMTFGMNGFTLTIQGKTFNLMKIQQIETGEEILEDGKVMVEYSDESPLVTIAGNMAAQVTPQVSGQNVNLNRQIIEEIPDVPDNLFADYSTLLGMTATELKDAMGSTLVYEDEVYMEFSLGGKENIKDVIAFFTLDEETFFDHVVMVDVFLSNIIEEAEVKALLNSKYTFLVIDEDGWYNYESGNMGIYFIPASKNYGDGNEIIYYDKKALWDSGGGTKVKRKYRSKKRN